MVGCDDVKLEKSWKKQKCGTCSTEMPLRETDKTRSEATRGGKPTLCTKLCCSFTAADASVSSLSIPQQRPASSWREGWSWAAGGRRGNAGADFEFWFWPEKENAPLFCFAFSFGVCSYSLFMSRNTEQRHRPKSSQKKQPNQRLFHL